MRKLRRKKGEVPVKALTVVEILMQYWQNEGDEPNNIQKKKKWEDLKENFSDEIKWHVEPLQFEILTPAILCM